MEIYVKIPVISIFFLFVSGFNHQQLMTSQIVTYRIFNTNL